jgi:hypothetical protein
MPRPASCPGEILAVAEEKAGQEIAQLPARPGRQVLLEIGQSSHP